MARKCKAVPRTVKASDGCHTCGQAWLKPAINATANLADLQTQIDGAELLPRHLHEMSAVTRTEMPAKIAKHGHGRPVTAEGHD